MRAVRARSGAAAGAVVALVAAAVAPLALATSSGPEPLVEPTLGPLISGTASQLAGTHVWTDYAYDDRGADAAAASADNAADLIQLQLRPGRDALRVRAVLETLLDPAVPAVGIGLDLDADPATGAPNLPTGGWKVTGTPLGLERAVVVDAVGAHVAAWNGTAWVPVGDAPADVDPAANTLTAAVPAALLGATGPRWRVVGTAALADGGAIRDLAYVRDTSRSNFQSNVQAAVLAGTDDAAKAVATIDVADVRGGRTVLAAPEPGIKNTFLYRSQLDLGEGIRSPDNRKYAGPYQPYIAWFPEEDLPARPPLVVFLHGAMGDHTGGSYGEDAHFVAGIGPGVIAPKAVIVTPLGRGETPLGGYDGPAEQDILDVIADASSRFAVDPDRVVMTGYSLGGVGTFRLAQLYPDRWAGAVEIVGAPDLGALTVQEEAGGDQSLPNQLENLRNLPFRLAHSRLDELELLVGGVQPDKAALELHRLGYDYRYWQFYRREHLAFPVEVIQCELEAAIARGRVKDPARVVYSQEPAIPTHDDRIGLHLSHDRAYWMSEMVVRGSTFAPGDKATVDISSLARADREPATELIVGPGENVTAGRDVCGDNADVSTADVWTVQGQRWLPGRSQPVSNGLVATLTGVASVTVDLPRMGVDVNQPLRVELTTDGGTRLRLAGPWRGAVSVEPAGQAPRRACATGGVLDVTAAAGASTVWIRPSSGGCR